MPMPTSTSNVTLRIFNVAGETRTKIRVGEDDTLTFRNDDPSRTLSVVIEGNPNALSKAGKPVNGFTVPASSEDTYTITSGFSGEFKYTATLEGLPSEDPIIIVG